MHERLDSDISDFRKSFNPTNSLYWQICMAINVILFCHKNGMSKEV